MTLPKSKEKFWRICHTKFTWLVQRISALQKGQTIHMLFPLPGAAAAF